MIARFLDAVFGCHHAHYSFPITVRRGQRRNTAAVLTGTYIVCLDCGKEFPYDWQQMRVTSEKEYATGVRRLATKEAA